MATLCDRDIENNVWVEGRDPKNPTKQPGACLLDTLGESSIIDILSRDPVAREDLKRVTSDTRLLELADKVPPLSTEIEGDKISQTLGQTKEAGPFYSQFRGRPPEPPPNSK